MSSEVLNIWQALAAINREIKAVGKDQTNTHFRYKFRGIDDVMNNLHPLFAKYGVMIAPEFGRPVIDVREVVGGNGKPRTERMCQVHITYSLVAADGTKMTAEGIGMGADDSDKGLNKAQVQSLKYMLLTLFTIPTDDMDEADQSGQTTSAASSAPPTYQATPEQKRYFGAECKRVGVESKEAMLAISEKCLGIPVSDLAATIEGLAKHTVTV